MAQLAGFLNVLLHGLILIGLSTAGGGVIYALWVLRPWGALSPLRQAAVGHALRLIAAGAGTVALCQLLLLLLQPWALADELGRWPLNEFLATAFAQASLMRGALALCLMAAAVRLLRHPASRRGWIVAALTAAAVTISGAWLVHAVSRMDGRAPLMALTVLHQLGAVIWIGGIIHLVGLWRLARRSPEGLWAQSLARFSPLAMLGVGMLLAAGVYLAWDYSGDWRGLIGSAYGVMVLTKVALLAVGLSLGAMNFLAVRRRARRAEGADLRVRVPAFVEAELGIGVILLLSAAALTSLPPAIDVADEWATPAEVASRFTPGMPRLVPPPREAFLANAASVLDIFAIPGAIERAQNEYNHHMAGFLVLAMGLLATLQGTGRARWARHWPLLFLGLAVFLFLQAEPTVWPLGPEGFWETLLVPAVLQHRLATLVVVGLGLFEWRVQARMLGETRWRYVFPLLCAVGGALLLTHSHTVFALKSEFLIEVSHALLGFLAVLTGCGRWLELRLPPPRNRFPGLLWRISLVLTGLLLVFYQEPDYL